MKNRTKAYVRHQRERIIQRKWYILKHVFCFEERQMPIRGTLNKGKVYCSCKMCRYEQFYGLPNSKYKEKWQIMQQEMNDYSSQDY